MKILLINPSCLAEAGRDLYSAQLLGPLFTFQPNTRMALGVPLALPTLAANTPVEHHVKIVDEEIEEINFDEYADIVGITAMTFKATRAYEIAKEFRARGVKVVMGGIHASMCPDEVSRHVDCVVIGEAEKLWPKLLIDVAEGKLKGRYKATEFPDLKESGVPRYDLVKNRQYLYSYLQTTRGCPFNCSFCTVTKFNGRAIRKKKPEQVINEVDALLKLKPNREFNVFSKAAGKVRRFAGTIAFIDDNFAIDRDHALSVCRAFQRYQEEHDIAIAWYTQVNFTVGFDEELLTEMANSNCQHLFIGFESLDQATLKLMRKKMNTPEKYAESIRNIHEHGIRVVYSTIIGDDNTSIKSVNQLIEFIRENNVFHVLLNILTPYPGTELFDNMKTENRILTLDPHLYNVRNVVFKPKGMSQPQLQALYAKACGRLFRFKSVYMRGKPMIGLSKQLNLQFFDRIAAWIGLSYTALSLTWKGRLRLSTTIRILMLAPFLILKNGNIFSIELLSASADYDDFACSETDRLLILQ